MFTIRPAALPDRAALAALYSQNGYPCTADEMQARLARIITDPAHAVLVAETTDTHEAVGVVHVGILPILDMGDTAEVLGVVVSPAQQRHGLGRTLIERAERWAMERHCRVIFLRANLLRTDAHSFYAQLGYTSEPTQFTFQKKLPH